MTYDQDRTRAKSPRSGTQERRDLAHDLATTYRAGASIREICTRTGLSYGLVHRLLDEANITFRPRGGANHKEK